MKIKYINMLDLYNYLQNNNPANTNEGLFKSAVGFAYIKRMSSDYLINGILNMYEYIIDKSDIKLFYEDFPLSERPFWTNLYKLYEDKIWCLLDVTREKKEEKKKPTPPEDNKKTDPNAPNADELKDTKGKAEEVEPEEDEEEDYIDECFTEDNKLIDVTPEFRRKLRMIIKNSSNKDADLKAATVNKIMLIDDPLFDKRYIFTISKIPGFLRKVTKAVDIKMLESLFIKISGENE